MSLDDRDYFISTLLYYGFDLYHGDPSTQAAAATALRAAVHTGISSQDRVLMACSALLWPESAADNMYSLDLSAVYSVAYLVEGSGPRAAPTAPTPPSLATAPETVVRDVVSVVAALGFYAMQVSTAVANRFFGWLDTAVQTNAVFKARVLMAILTVPRSARPGAAAPLLTSTTTASAILSPHLQPTVLPMVARTLAARPYTPLMLLAADMFWDPVMPGVLSAMMAAPPHVRDPALAALISGSVAATTSAAATPIAAAAIAASTNGTTVTPRYYQSLLDWLVTYQLGPQFNPATDLPPFTAANKVASRVPAAHRKMAVQLAALDTVAAMATRDRGWAARNLDAVGALAATGLARSAKAAAAARMVLDATAPTTGATSGTLGAAQVVSDRWISLALDLSATLVTPHAAVTWAEHLARVLERSAATVAGGLGGVSDKALRALAAETSPLWRLRASFAAVGAVNDAVDRVAAATLSVACSTASASASSRPTVNNDGTAGGNYTNGFAPHVSDLAQEDDDDNANHDPLDALRDLLVHYEVVSDDASVLVSSTRVGGAASNTLPPALAGDNCKLARFVRVIGRVVELDALDVVPVRSASRTRVHPPTQLPGGPVRPPPPSSSTTTSLLDLLAAAAMDALALAYANNSHGLSVLASALTQLLALPRRWNHQSVAAVAGVAATQWLPVRLRKVALATLAESAAAAAISPDTLAVAITGVLGHRTPAPVLCDLLALVLTCVPDEAIAELSDEACEMVILQAVAETVESYDDDGQQQQQQWMRLASRIPRAVPTHSLDQFKRCVMAAPHAGQFHAQHVHRLLASTGRALPIADLQRLFASTAVGLTMPAHLWRSREALETYAAWEAARFCVLVRFKTPVGSASATLMAIETLVHRKQTMAVRILDAIDRWLLVADAGSAAASASSGLLPPPLPPAAAKYLTDNGATMAEWTARVRRAAVRAATQAGWRVSAVAHAMALAAAPSRKHATRVDVGVAARHLAALGVPDLVDGFSSVFGSDLDRSRALACGAVETFPADEDEGGGTGREDAVTVIGGGGASSLGSSTNNATAATPGISLATAYLVMSDYRAMDQFYAEHVLHGEDQGMDAMHAEMLEQICCIDDGLPTEPLRRSGHVDPFANMSPADHLRAELADGRPTKALLTYASILPPHVPVFLPYATTDRVLHLDPVALANGRDLVLLAATVRKLHNVEVAAAVAFAVPEAEDAARERMKATAVLDRAVRIEDAVADPGAFAALLRHDPTLFPAVAGLLPGLEAQLRVAAAAQGQTVGRVSTVFAVPLSELPGPNEVGVTLMEAATMVHPGSERVWRKWAAFHMSRVGVPAHLQDPAEAAPEANDQNEKSAEAAAVATLEYLTRVRDGNAASADRAIAAGMQLLALVELVLSDTFVVDTVLPRVAGTLVAVWRFLLPQLRSFLRHPRHAVVDVAAALMAAVGQRYPSDCMYPLVAEAIERPENAAVMRLLESLGDPTAVETTRALVQQMQGLTVLRPERWYHELTRLTRALAQVGTDVDGVFRDLDWLRFHHLRDATASHDLQFRALAREKIEVAVDEAREIWDNIRDAIPEGLSPADHRALMRPIWYLFEPVLALVASAVAHTTQLHLEDVGLVHGLDLSAAYMPGRRDRIARVAPTFGVLSTKTKPKKLMMVSAEGTEHVYLVKGLEDLHLDQRIVQVVHTTNTIVAGRAARGNGGARAMLKLAALNGGSAANVARGYAVVPLGRTGGIIEWVSAEPMYAIYRRQYQARHPEGASPPRPAAAFLASAARVLSLSDRAMVQLQRYQANPAAAAASIRRRCTPAQLLAIHRDLVATAASATGGSTAVRQQLVLATATPWQALQVQRRFAQSVAVMAVVGHALGLGDRHLDNILCDVAAGTIVHIDFNMAFGRGALLRVPEIVPFRMSPMFLAAMGYNVGLQGPFAAAAARTAAMLRSRTAATLVTRLIESLVLDAEWDAAGGGGGGAAAAGGSGASGGAADVAGGSGGEGDDSDPESSSLDALNAMQLNDDDDDDDAVSAGAAGPAGGSVNDEDDHRRAAALAILTTVRRKLAGAVAPDGSSEVLSVEDQIQRLIDMATDETRAASMYEGWTPWI